MASAAKKQCVTARLANKKDLEKVEWTISQLAGTGYLKPLARDWLAFCVAVVKLGYTGIKAPIGAITKAQYRSVARSQSDSSTHRGLRQLEDAGYLRRKKLRLGKDRFVSEITFNLNRFAYFTRSKQSYIAPQLSNWAKSEATSNRSCVNSQDHSVKDNMPARDRDRHKSVGKTPSGKRRNRSHREQPIVYTLRCVVRGDRRRYIIARAIVELNEDSLRSSGVDWPKWIGRWSQLTIGEREHIARTQIVPYLDKSCPGANRICPSVQSAQSAVSTRSAYDVRPVSIESIAAMLSGTPIGRSITAAPGAVQADRPDSGQLDPSDLAILSRARDRIKDQSKRGRG